MTHEHDFRELGRISLSSPLPEGEGYAVAVAQCACGSTSFAANFTEGTTTEWIAILKVASAMTTAAIPHVEDALHTGYPAPA